MEGLDLEGHALGVEIAAFLGDEDRRGGKERQGGDHRLVLFHGLRARNRQDQSARNSGEHRKDRATDRHGVSPNSSCKEYYTARSEEQTYELKSLMRTPYAAYCLQHKQNA